MGNLDRIAVVLSLLEKLESKGSWCGETHIQKSVFFLEKMRDVSLGFEFIFYKYGPFSFDLREELKRMRIYSLLKWRLNPDPYGPSFLPGEDWKELKESHKKILQQHEDDIEYVAGILGGKKVAELERLATALYVTKEGSADDSVASRAKRMILLKPRISESDAETAVNEIDRFLQVTT